MGGREIDALSSEIPSDLDAKSEDVAGKDRILGRDETKTRAPNDDGISDDTADAVRSGLVCLGLVLLSLFILLPWMNASLYVCSSLHVDAVHVMAYTSDGVRIVVRMDYEAACKGIHWGEESIRSRVRDHLVSSVQLAAKNFRYDGIISGADHLEHFKCVVWDMIVANKQPFSDTLHMNNLALSIDELYG